VNSAQEFLSSRVALWIIGAVGLALFLTTNLPWQLDDYDQAKQAFTSFEMIKEGHWLYQRTPLERVATKPPLVGWTSAGLFAITRSWGLAWRLPSFLSAIGISILLFRAGSVYGAAGGVIGASAFVFNLLSPRLATLVRTDMPLALVIFLIGLIHWQKVRKCEPWNSRDRWSIFALLTAGLLIKGPIIYAFLLPGIVIFSIIRRRDGPSTPRDESVLPADRTGVYHRIWCDWWPWYFSLAIFLLWVIGGSIFVRGFFEQVVVREFIARFGETIHRPQPLLFYLPHLLQKFFPWSVLVVALATLDLRSRQWRIRPVLREMKSETVWLVCWILGGLILMSLIPSKRVDRIFPIVPPLCLLLAAQIGKALPDEQLRERVLPWSVAALLLSIVFTTGYTVSKVTAGFRDHSAALVAFGRAVRSQAAVHHWRYEVMKSSDEGMLLYLEKTHFIEPERAVMEWNRGNLDALVAPVRKAPALMREMRDAALSQLKSTERKGEPTSYVLITR
jgi:4-amino-4-deoxy-L-arabinose transferase-like glycosyltransferase